MRVRFLIPCVLAAAAAAGDWKLSFVADANIPTGTPFEAVGRAGAAERAAMPQGVLARKVSGGFGGISALAFDRKSGTLYALSDSAAPVLFALKFALRGGAVQLSPVAAIPLKNADGGLVAEWTLDPEGLALLPRGTLLLSSEGYPVRSVDPALVEFDSQGRTLRRLPVPPKFLPASSEGTRSGVRHNLGFEGLTLAPDGKRFYTVTEGPLEQDGPGCSTSQACTSRILEYTLEGGEARPAREFAYPIEAMPLPAALPNAKGHAGASELLALSGNELLVLERGFAFDEETKGMHQTIRIYHATLEGASDVSGMASLAQAGSWRPVAKRLLLDLESVVPQFSQGYRKLDNFEGMCLGPRLKDGSRTLILVSDNNYGDNQRTAFVVLRLTQ
ncbi:MAG TPA: esterase-like activity of phytase family protein [Bryobacteraceae bacterium]|nr:esterase-like activity of phytase family protein [Bryobacteraceae bacterium]